MADSARLGTTYTTKKWAIEYERTIEYEWTFDKYERTFYNTAIKWRTNKRASKITKSGWITNKWTNKYTTS